MKLSSQAVGKSFKGGQRQLKQPSLTGSSASRDANVIHFMEVASEGDQGAGSGGEGPDGRRQAGNEAGGDLAKPQLSPSTGLKTSRQELPRGWQSS